MADEKTVVKGKEENFFTKLINFFKKLPGAIARPFKNMWHELRKVTWPSRQDVIKYSLIVLLFLVFMGVVIGLLDLGSTAVVKLLTPAATIVEQVEDHEGHDHEEAVTGETVEEPAADADAEPVAEQPQEDAAAETAETPEVQEEAAQP